MLQLIAATQPLVIGAVLVWSARFKLFSRHAAANVRRSAFGSLMGDRYALPSYRLLGAVELTLGALLIAPPVLWWEAIAATALTVGFLGYLAYAKAVVPESSCGCLSAQATPISWRGIVRAGFLVLASLLVIPATSGWLVALKNHPVAGGLVLVGEVAVIVALSPELDSRWLFPARRLRARLTHPLRGGSGVPLLASVQQLQLSDAYRGVAGLLTSDVRDHWDDDEWRMISHSARFQGRAATAVFAVPLLRHEPSAVRVAIVDEATGSTLLSLAGAPSAATS